MLRMYSLVGAGLFVLSSYAPASDLAKEQRWADQIVDSLIDGEAVWLDADGTKFLGIYTEAEDGASRRGAIILHGIGVHPNWQQVVYPLRTRLPAAGWNTLSLQMPILPNDAEESAYAAVFGEIAPRLDAGSAYLTQRGVDDIVIIGHSLGATMAAYYLANGDRDIRALVALGMPRGVQNSDIENAKAIVAIEIPVLDVYGSDDSEDVLAAVPLREAAKAQATGATYRSQKIDGANHFYEGQEDALLGVVSDWLAATAPAH